MNLQRFLVVLALVVAMGIALVFQHAMKLRLGYRIAQLDARRDELMKENARISAEITREKDPKRLQAKLEALGLRLVPAGAQPETIVRRPESGVLGER